MKETTSPTIQNQTCDIVSGQNLASHFILWWISHGRFLHYVNLLQDLVHQPCDHIKIWINQSIYQPYIDDALCLSFFLFLDALGQGCLRLYQGLPSESGRCASNRIFSRMFQGWSRLVFWVFMWIVHPFSTVFPYISLSCFCCLLLSLLQHCLRSPASDACCRSSFRPLVKVLASFKASSAAWNPGRPNIGTLRWRKWWWKMVNRNQEAEMIQQRRVMDDLYKLTTIYCTSLGPKQVMESNCPPEVCVPSPLWWLRPLSFQKLGASCLCIAVVDVSTAMFGCELICIHIYTYK